MCSYAHRQRFKIIQLCNFCSERHVTIKFNEFLRIYIMFCFAYDYPFTYFHLVLHTYFLKLHPWHTVLRNSCAYTMEKNTLKTHLTDIALYKRWEHFIQVNGTLLVAPLHIISVLQFIKYSIITLDLKYPGFLFCEYVRCNAKHNNLMPWARQRSMFLNEQLRFFDVGITVLTQMRINIHQQDSLLNFPLFGKCILTPFIIQL